MQWGERLFSINGSSPYKFAQEDCKKNFNFKSNQQVETLSQPLSLKETVMHLKQPKHYLCNRLQYCRNGMGLEAVLAWHAFPGYWLGLTNDVEHSDYEGPTTTIHYPHF